jgi:hypothetical protein
MRIRQVRPEFFTDPVVSSLSPATRLTYIGLWCVADDAGWLRFDVAHVGALLFPFMPVAKRQKAVATAGSDLVTARRLVLYDCGCGHIPTMPKHQRSGGKPSFVARDEHFNRHVTDKSVVVQNNLVVTERNVTERNVTSGPDRDEFENQMTKNGANLSVIKGKSA